MKMLNQFNQNYRQIFNRKVNQKIFFLHFPKCGGTSIDQAIRNSFGYFEKSNLFHLNPQSSLKAAKIAENDLMDYREKILLYYMSNSNYKYISGHFKYSEKVYQNFGEKWNFIKIIRHPVKKWLSHYFFNKYKEDPHFGISENIEEFLETERGIALGCDYVSKLVNRVAEYNFSSDDAIKEAMINLEKFSLVGVLEDTENFVNNFHNLFGAKLFIKKQNSNPLSKAKQQEEITDKIKNKLEEICKPNMRIYEYVLERIKSRESLVN